MRYNLIMDTLHFTIDINASKQHVWDVMLGDETYRQWTAPFHEGSYYEGTWDQGSTIRFLGPGENGEKPGGMVSKIAENRPYEFISIEHQGLVGNGVDDTTSEWAQAWSGATENYTFSETDGVTTVNIDLASKAGAVPEAMKQELAGMWPSALAKLKELAEA